jgi:hypothetical protein
MKLLVESNFVLGIVGCRFWYDWAIGSAAGLHLHTSNRLERLFAELAGIVSESPGSILQRGIVMVQTNIFRAAKSCNCSGP